MNTLNSTRLREFVSYDPDTGVFTWAQSKGRAKRGTSAGWRKSNGYVGIHIDGKNYLAHRLAWLYVHGVWPPDMLDHINGVRDDNRITNLRCVSAGDNLNNQRAPHANSKSGYLGVSPWRNKWRAVIQVNRKQVHLGVFDTPETAHHAYVEAKRAHHQTNQL